MTEEKIKYIIIKNLKACIYFKDSKSKIGGKNFRFKKQLTNCLGRKCFKLRDWVSIHMTSCENAQIPVGNLTGIRSTRVELTQGNRKMIEQFRLSVSIFSVHVVFLCPLYVPATLFWRELCLSLLYNFSLHVVSESDPNVKFALRTQCHCTDSVFQSICPKLLRRRYNKPNLARSLYIVLPAMANGQKRVPLTWNLWGLHVSQQLWVQGTV